MMTISAGVAPSYRRVFVCATTSSVYEFLGRCTSQDKTTLPVEGRITTKYLHVTLSLKLAYCIYARLQEGLEPIITSGLLWVSAVTSTHPTRVIDQGPANG
jgi:hypothetical protein